MEKRKKICYLASSGGHLEEILGLYPMKDGYDSFLITEKTSFKLDVWQQKVYTMPPVNRSEWTKYLKLLVTFVKSFFIFLAQRPDVVISTGVLMTVPVCVVAKIFRKSLIFIESIARVNSGSATGKFAYKRADLFIVQWEELLAVYPNAVLGGPLI